MDNSQSSEVSALSEAPDYVKEFMHAKLKEDDYASAVNGAAAVIQSLESQDSRVARLSIYLLSPDISSRGKASIANRILDAYKAGGDNEKLSEVLKVEEYFRTNLISVSTLTLLTTPLLNIGLLIHDLQ